MTTVKDASFRDLYHAPCILRYGMEKLLEAHEVAGLEIPASADSVLAYPYIDHEAGFTFEVLAPANYESGRYWLEDAPLEAENMRILVRRGAVAETDVKPCVDLSGVTTDFAGHMEMIDKYYEGEKDLLATRGVKAIDPLRNEDYPDDVLVTLVCSDDGSVREGVWVRLETIDEEGMFEGTLLNQPYSECGVNRGDLLQLALVSGSDGSYQLASTPEMLAG